MDHLVDCLVTSQQPLRPSKEATTSTKTHHIPKFKSFFWCLISAFQTRHVPCEITSIMQIVLTR